MSLPKYQYSLANVLDVIDTSDSEFEGFESESDGEFSPYCSNQSSESDSEVDDSSDLLDHSNQTLIRKVNGNRMMMFLYQAWQN